MKRVISHMLIIPLTIILTLSACTNTKDASSVGSGKPIVTPTNIIFEEPYEINMYHPGPGTQKDKEIIEKEASKLLSDMNTTLNINCIAWADWYEKKKLIINSGQKADLVFTSSWSEYFEEVGKNYWMPLNELLEQNGKEIKKVISKDLIEVATVKGSLYAIPVDKEIGAVFGLLFNKKFLDQYGIDITKIRSLTDLEPILESIQEKEGQNGIVPYLLDGDGNPISILYKNTFETIGADISAGAIRRDGNDYKVINQYKEQEMLEVAKLVYKWRLKGLFNVYDPNTIANQAELRKQNKYFCMTSSLKPGKDREMMLQSGVELMQYYWDKPYKDTNSITGAMMSMPKGCENPTRTMMFLSRLYTDEKLVNILVNGIEGRHYIKNQDNKISFPKSINASNSPYLPQNNWQIGSQYLNLIWDIESSNKFEEFKNFSSSAVKSRIIGFTYSGNTVKVEEGNCMKIIGDYMNKFGNGILDPTKEYETFLDKLDQAGVNAVIDEKQMQLDQWIKR